MGEIALEDLLAEDHAAALLIGRLWLPAVAGPAVILIRDDRVFDLSPQAPTVSGLFEQPDLAAWLRGLDGLEEIMPLRELGDAVAAASAPDGAGPHLLAPCDLQTIKAAGVTFAGSLLERLVEEQAKGDYLRADEIRAAVHQSIGADLASVVPGSPEAAALKARLAELGAWSQYMEVGLGPDAEIFSKAAPMSSVGCGQDIGLHPRSEWSNPEPEVVVAVNSRGEIVGATLGNDVNLRDFEGRSALLLGRSKDNNASCAIGPFIRVFDDAFTLDDVRNARITLKVEGPDGYDLEGSSDMAQISRDPTDLVAQTIGAHHQYPDGVLLFLGTLFAPVEDRDTPGMGFTHKIGDLVSISSPRLGSLVNRVDTSDRAAPWDFGALALMRNLAARGLLT